MLRIFHTAEDEAAARVTLTTTVDRVDAWAFESARMIEAVGGVKGAQAIEAMLAEGLTELMAREPGIDLPCPTSASPEVLESLLAQHKDNPTIIFTADNDTVHHISRTWLAPVLTHETPAPERKATLDEFAAGRVRAIVTARVLEVRRSCPRRRPCSVTAADSSSLPLAGPLSSSRTSWPTGEPLR